MDKMHCWFSNAHRNKAQSRGGIITLHYQLESGEIVPVTNVAADKTHEEEYQKLWPDAVYLGVGTYHHGSYHSGIELETHYESPLL